MSSSRTLKILVFAVVLFFLTLSVILLSCVPPVSRDALTHHLAVPALWLKHGGICEIPAIVFSYYPMNLDLLYTIPLFFGNDIVPKFIHFSFALLTAWLLFAYLKKRLDTLYALSGVLFFLSLPVIVKLSITIYVDLGLIFFSTASIICLLKWIEENFRVRFLLLSAFFCGLALGTKYNGLVVFFLLTLFVPFAYANLSAKHGAGKKSLLGASDLRAPGYALVFLMVALIVFSPWMLRNHAWTGNPIYPLYDGLFNPSPPDASDVAKPVGHFAVRSLNYHESWWEIALIPVRIFFQGQDNNPKYFDGRLNPLLFFLPFFAGYGWRKKNHAPVIAEKRILLFFSVLFLLFAFFRVDMRTRYVAPIIPPLVMLSVFGLHGIFSFLGKRRPGRIGRIAAGSVLFATCGLMGMNMLYIVRQFEHVDPIPYIAGKVSRDEYITKYRKEYPVFRFANKNLPEDAKILGVFLGNRLYHSEREMVFDTRMLRKIIKQADSPRNIMVKLGAEGISHLLVRLDLFKKWADDNFDEQEKKRLAMFSDDHLTSLFHENGYGLFRLVN